MNNDWPFVTVLLRRPWALVHGRAHILDQHGTVFRVRAIVQGNEWRSSDLRRADEGRTWVRGWRDQGSTEVHGLKTVMSSRTRK